VTLKFSLVQNRLHVKMENHLHGIDLIDCIKKNFEEAEAKNIYLKV